MARPKEKKPGLTKAGKAAPPFSDLLGRDFDAEKPNLKWCGDFKQVESEEGPAFLASCLDLFSRRMLGFALSDRYPTADLATAATNMAVAVRGGDVAGVIFHSDRGSQGGSDAFEEACRKLGIAQSMGRVGSALDNAAAESFFSTLEHELLSRRRFVTRAEARTGRSPMDRPVLQPEEAPQHQRIDVPNRLRERRYLGRRSSIRNPPRFGGKLTRALRP